MKIVLIGFGIWGKVIFRELLACEMHVDVVDIDSNQLEAARKMGAIQTFASIADYNKSGIKHDGIILATNTSEHHLNLPEIWAKGAPIFCEKPLFASAAHFDILRHAPKDLVLHVMHIWQQHPAVLAIQDAIDSGLIGQIQTLRTERLGWTSPRRDVGCIANLLIHDLTLVESIIGPSFQLAHASVERDLDGVDRWAQAIFSGSKNITASVEIGNRSPRKSRLIRVQGTLGVIEFDEARNQNISLWQGTAGVPEQATEKTTIFFDRQASAMRRQIQTWLSFLQGGPAPLGTVAQAHRLAYIADLIDSV